METVRFIERVRTEAGLPPASFVDSGLAADQSHRIDTLILDLGKRYACEELTAGPLPVDTPLKELSLFFLWIPDGEGEQIGKAPLPQDFLRLGSLRMDSWDFTLTTLLSPSESAWKLRHSPVSSLAGNSRRPQGYLLPGADGLQLEIRSCRNAGERIAEGCYASFPDFSDEDIKGVGRETIEKVISRVADYLRNFP